MPRIQLWNQEIPVPWLAFNMQETVLGLLYDKFSKIANWPGILTLLVCTALGAKAFDWRQQRLGAENTTFDVQFWYTQGEGKTFLKNIGQEGRNFYAATQLTLDLIFPVIYGTLFATLIVRFYNRSTGSYLLALPLLVVAFDFLENICTVYLSLSFDKNKSPDTSLSAVCSATKWTFLIATGIVTLVGLLWLLKKQFLKTPSAD